MSGGGAQVFIYDPLYKWALSPLKALQRQQVGTSYLVSYVPDGLHDGPDGSSGVPTVPDAPMVFCMFPIVYFISPMVFLLFLMVFLMFPLGFLMLTMVFLITVHSLPN